MILTKYEEFYGKQYVEAEQYDKILLELKKSNDKIDNYQSENENLKHIIDEISKSRSEWIDKAVEWQLKCEKFEEKETEKSKEIDTCTPLDCANSLINHLTHLEAFLIAPERYERTFTIDDLEQIAEHLLVYCKHNKEVEE